MEQLEFQRYHEASFDAFCKKVIKTIVADYYRNTQQQGTAPHLSESIYSSLIESCVTTDRYSLYSRTFYVQDIAIDVHNEEIGEALQFIVPKKRSVLLLSYFMEYCDSDIAKILEVSVPTVARRKKAALSELRDLMRGAYHAN